MEKIKISDTLFGHVDYSTLFQISKYFTWDRSPILGNENMVVYTDNTLRSVDQRVKYKIAWILESPAVTVGAHNWIKQNHKLFDVIFTNNKDLLDIGDKFKFAPTAGCWIKPEDQRIHQKTKIVSIVASSKNFTKGHQLRLETIKRINGIDVYGRQVNPIDYKLDGLKDYMFSIVIENTKKDYYFTEKLIDCFATGTIPIYWGCPSIGDYFNEDGMIIFDKIEDLYEIISELDEDLYNSKRDAVKENFDLSKEYLIAEDYIYKNYLKI